MILILVLFAAIGGSIYGRGLSGEDLRGASPWLVVGLISGLVLTVLFDPFESGAAVLGVFSGSLTMFCLFALLFGFTSGNED
jgi:hypothetical protein